ncbi:hypothetical protein MKW98_022616 [Papaver atlanticum]|uniref:Uncharacterized protein n=1 Tax=Papaver atlanticum TaxID=357466 RepID=A0AAD4XGQ6_9MAGN|nr:hypothetical protein MKW98_022616 [Papaver atlanticum]
MAPSLNRFCVVVLVLVASTSFLVDKAQAYGYRSCMNNCDSSYLICFHYCLGSALGVSYKLSVGQTLPKSKLNAHSEHYKAPRKVQGSEKH